MVKKKDSKGPRGGAGAPPGKTADSSGIDQAPAPGDDQAPAPRDDQAPAPGDDQAPAPGDDQAPAPGDDQAPAPAASRLAAAVATGEGSARHEEAEAGAEIEFLCVRIKDRRYAIPVAWVAEVVTPGDVTPVPHTPSYIRGVFNRHGHVSTVLDLAQFTGTELEENPTRLVVLEADSLEAAVPVTEVTGIVAMANEDVAPPLPSVAHESGFIIGQITQGSDILSVIDVSILLGSGRHTWGLRKGE